MKRKINLGIIAVVLPALLFFFLTNVQAAKKVRKGWLGVHVQELTPSLKDAMKIGDRKGLLITEVVEKSPAEKGGLEDGDVLLSYDGKSVEMAKTFAKMVKNTPPGTNVKIKVFREGDEKELKVEIGKLKKTKFMKFGDKNIMIYTAGRPRLGVEVREINADLAPYFKVKANQGVLVLEIHEDSPAEAAGLKSGDVILKVEDEETDSPAELIEILSEYEEGDEIKLVYLRAGKTARATVKLEEFHHSSKDFMHLDDDNIFIHKQGTKKEKRIKIKRPEKIIEEHIEWHDDDHSIL